MRRSLVKDVFLVQILMSVTQTMEAVITSVSMMIPPSTVSAALASTWMRMNIAVLVSITSLCVMVCVHACGFVHVCVCVCVCACRLVFACVFSCV